MNDSAEQLKRLFMPKREWNEHTARVSLTIEQGAVTVKVLVPEAYASRVFVKRNHCGAVTMQEDSRLRWVLFATGCPDFRGIRAGNNRRLSKTTTMNDWAEPFGRFQIKPFSSRAWIRVEEMQVKNQPRTTVLVLEMEEALRGTLDEYETATSGTDTNERSQEIDAAAVEDCDIPRGANSSAASCEPENCGPCTGPGPGAEEICQIGGDVP